ncbi:MAG: hypothetical protein IPG91_06720 [Ideonella sp.]|nr:hypothetical protein [Ideonella sp.]
MARKLLAVISEPLPLRGPAACGSTGGCGIAVMYPADGDDAQVLLKNADAAVCQARAGGGNGFRFSRRRSPAQSALLSRSGPTCATPSSVARSSSLPAQVRHRRRRAARHQALVRWQHPKRDLVAPLEFIRSPRTAA